MIALSTYHDFYTMTLEMEKDCQLFANVMVNKIQKFQFNYYRVPTLLKDSDLSKKETDFSHFLQIRSKFYVGIYMKICLGYLNVINSM